MALVIYYAGVSIFYQWFILKKIKGLECVKIWYEYAEHVLEWANLRQIDQIMYLLIMPKSVKTVTITVLYNGSCNRCLCNR